jgi:hypothetical protein
VLVAVGSVALAAVVIVVGCQTYDFEPVQPLAIAQTTASYSTVGRSLRANMALLVDKSGSMDFPLDPTNAACPTGCAQTGQPKCPAGCPTRWTELKSAMTQFLTTSGSVARMGLAFFPPGGCNPTSSMSQDVSSSNDVASELQTWSTNILSKITSTNPSGGTPTAASLAFVAGNPGLADPDRDNFILLLTDGLPNCNGQFTPSYPDPACRCTDTNTDSCNQSPQQLCLDQSNAVNAITAAFRDHSIRTIVVGFGADTQSGDGPAALQAMAVAGQFPRTCPSGTNAECGTGTCDAANKTCTPAFYQATNAADLARVLESIAKHISQTPCDYLLDVTPSNEAFISLLVNGSVVARDDVSTWTYVGPGGDGGGAHGKVKLVGALCDQAKAATPDVPVKVEIRLLRTF